MTSHENPVSDDPEQKRSILKPLFTWPIALVAVTLGILLVTNTVSAWGHRDEDRVENFKEHAEFFVGRMLRKIDATEEQNLQIQQIVDRTIDELASLHGEKTEMRDEVAALMTAQTVDRDAIEAMRVSHLARADQMSRIVSKSLADTMEVLTVDQRIELETRISKHARHRRGGWH